MLSSRTLRSAAALLAVAAIVSLAFALTRRDPAPPAIAAPAPHAAPPNDNVAAAPNIYVDAMTPHQTYTGDTIGATLEPGEQRPCGNIGATVWFYYSSYLGGALTVDTAGSSFDTVLAVWEIGPDIVSSPPGGGVLIGCNDNGLAAQSTVTFQALPGHQYWIQAGGAGGQTGTLSLNLACTPSCPPPNDSFGNFIGGGPLPIDQDASTAGATTEAGEPQPCGGIGKTLWYAVFVPGNTDVVVDTAGSDFPTAVAAYSIPTLGLQSLADLVLQGCNATGAAKLTFHVSPGIGYYVQAGGQQGASGRLRIHIDCTPGPCPPYNDSSGNPSYIEMPSLFPYASTLDTRGATLDGGEPTSCGNMGRTVWYTIAARGSATLVFNTNGSNFPGAIALYQGEFSSPPGQLHQVACATSPAGAQARMQFDAPRGSTFFLQVGGMDGAGGDLHLQGDCLDSCPPVNDDIANPAQLYAAPVYEDARNTRAATLESGEQQPCGNIGKTVWYALGPGSGFHFSTAGSSYSTVIAVYAWTSASPPGSLASVACTSTGQLDFTPQPGVGYMVQVGGDNGAGGELHFRADCLGDCPVYPPQTGGQGGDGVVAVDTGGISPPNTGSGGYLPGARRPGG